MKKIFKKLDPIFQFIFKKYYSRPRVFKYQNIKVLVHPEVFPPHFTWSTKILLKYIETLNLKNKLFLELGCGAGIISLLAASKGAKVTASDINRIALNALEKAAIKNNLNVTILYSDLFDTITEKHFDYIVINPPYYPKKATNDKEKAWYCGPKFEYFKKLFKQLSLYLENSKTVTLMILSDDCKIDEIQKIAFNHGLKFNLIHTDTSISEINYIYKITTS